MKAILRKNSISKSRMVSLFRAIIAAVMLLVANVLHAQLQFSSDDLAAIEATTPTSADALPVVGTFYSAADPQCAPAPENVLGWPAWDLGNLGGNEIYLLDDLDSSAGGMDAPSGGRFHPMDDPTPPPGDGAYGGFYEFTNTYSFPTNGLWLQITNPAVDTVFANLNGATDYVYEIFSTTNLMQHMAVSNWDIETEVFPTDTNSMPFTVSMNGRNPLYLWARDWTGITSNGNTTPDWWFWYYFGTINLSDDDLDPSGNTLLSDYRGGADPNVIQFSINVTNNYGNNRYAPVQLSISQGILYYYAVTVDDTNYQVDADWQPYTGSNILVDLGMTQGWHNVWVGLRGLPVNATQSWQWQRLNLTYPPLIVITNPTTSIVDEPVIQIYGYCQEPLTSINYDLSNAAGVFLGQPSEVTDQYFDTNAFGITTNYFECLDVPLTNGPNVITMHATNMAGGNTTTNFYFTLDYSAKTNPPILQINWPQNGAQISGTNITCTGWISDPTATVTTQIIVTNSNTNLFYNGLYTNTYYGATDRSGNFWLQNLPLKTGTNTITIAATDVVGNTTVTNISVVQTNFILTINPVSPDSQLWQATVNLTGIISDPTYAVWVNGVKGTNNGNGTWSANNVPVNKGGTANFNVTAYTPSEQQPDGSYGN
jgi:hypothetical protein